ncbi:MAG TPA: acyl-CoA dehydrogenase family protein [Myxococcota bacterium]|nr:acyl-CoA dehydrogenase family protein [Myxococcota bacterium]
MDLRYSRQDEAFRAELREWLAKEVPAHGHPPPPGDWPARRAYDTAWQRKLFDAGYAGVSWPAAFGGRGLPISQQLVYLEEYARAGAPYVGVNFVGLMHAGPTLIAEGSDAQRRAHLPRILRGDAVWCQGFSEPGAGSDLAALATRAERDGDDYVISGQKIWSTRAHVADYCELLVRTDPAAPRHKGITWLILDMHQPGVEVRPMRTLDGESHFCELFLDRARVPVANRVGAENDGWRVTNVTLRFERGTAFAQHIITMRAHLRRLVALALARGSEPGAGWTSDAVRAKVGRLDASVEALWRMTQMCVAEAERTGAPSLIGSAVKLRYSELSQEIAELALRLVGEPIVARADRDTVPTAEIVREYLWSLQYTIAAGTSQIQRNLIAERILGLPKGR